MSVPTQSILESTTGVRPGFEIDTGHLDAYLRSTIADYRGPLEVRQFSGGQSNPTYVLLTPDCCYVLRRKPPGQLVPSAHAVDREYRVLNALGATGSVPVAHTYTLCMDDSVIGTAFYVMDYLAGRTFWDASFPDVLREQRRQYFEAMVAGLASVHSVDYVAAGLQGFGKPEKYLERQIARWAKTYAQDEPSAGRVAAMERLLEWLPANLPSQQDVAVVHGDYRCDNVMFHPTEPRVLAILDWELSTIGDPLSDFAYHLMMYRMPALGVTGLAGMHLQLLNIPNEDQYVGMYCRLTGRRNVPHLDFYVAFAMFRLAGIFHGIRGRLVRGTASSAKAREYAQHVEALAELAWNQATRSGNANR
jgi:aminoglycoside phosphotransferase (APT) family kinase protein